MIIIVAFVATALAIVFSLRMPDMYTATARILPPQESNQGLPGFFTLFFVSG
jgi:LPS O-antigen subunit length determinant protein (WzzB/FepE family)